MLISYTSRDLTIKKFIALGSKSTVNSEKLRVNLLLGDMCYHFTYLPCNLLEAMRNMIVSGLFLNRSREHT